MKVATGWHELNRQCYNGHWDPRCSLQTYHRNSCMYVIFSRMWFEIIFFEIIFSLRHSAPVNGSITAGTQPAAATRTATRWKEMSPRPRAHSSSSNSHSSLSLPCSCHTAPAWKADAYTCYNLGQTTGRQNTTHETTRRVQTEGRRRAEAGFIEELKR